MHDYKNNSNYKYIGYENIIDMDTLMGLLTLGFESGTISPIL